MGAWEALPDRAQRFTTGTNPGGYTLTGIDLSLRSENAGTTPPTVTLHRGSPTGPTVADLNGPTALTAGTTDTYRFTPTGTVRLSGLTNYWVVAKGGSNDIDWRQTESNAEDATPADGWTIQYGSGFQFTGANPFIPSTRALRLSVHGTARERGANTSAAGAPAITAPGGFRVAELLGVDLSGIGDANGAEDIAHKATYRWQRFDSTGANLEADRIGRASTYTPTGRGPGQGPEGGGRLYRRRRLRRGSANQRRDPSDRRRGRPHGRQYRAGRRFQCQLYR